VKNYKTENSFERNGWRLGRNWSKSLKRLSVGGPIESAKELFLTREFRSAACVHVRIKQFQWKLTVCRKLTRGAFGHYLFFKNRCSQKVEMWFPHNEGLFILSAQHAPCKTENSGRDFAKLTFLVLNMFCRFIITSFIHTMFTLFELLMTKLRNDARILLTNTIIGKRVARNLLWGTIQESAGRKPSKAC